MPSKDRDKGLDCSIDVSLGMQTRNAAASSRSAVHGKTVDADSSKPIALNQEGFNTLLRHVRALEKTASEGKRQFDATVLDLQTQMEAEAKRAATLQQQLDALEATLKEDKANTDTFTDGQVMKISAMVDVALAAEREQNAKAQKAEVARLEAIINAKTARITTLEEQVEKYENSRAEPAAATSAAEQAMSEELEKLKATVELQGSTLDALSSQHTSYDSTLAKVELLGTRVKDVERGMADSSNRAAAIAERQELQRVLPAVVVTYSKSQKKDVAAAVDAALAKGLEEAENKQMQVPKDLSFTIKQFGGRKAEDTSSGSRGKGADTEKVLVTFNSAPAAAFMLKVKRKLPDGIYAEPLLTSQEKKIKADKFPLFKSLKAKSRQVTWWRARMMEFRKNGAGGAGRWVEVREKEEQVVHNSPASGSGQKASEALGWG